VTRRLLVSYLALTLIVLLFLEIPLGLTFQDRLEKELASGLERDAFTIASVAEETAEQPNDPVHLGVTTDLGRLATSYADRTGGRVVIVDASGRALADSNPTAETENFGSRDEITEALAGRVSSGTRHSTTLNTDLFYVAVPIASGQVYGAVRITYSADQVEARIHQYWRILGAITIVSLLAATALGIRFARWVVRPIDSLGDAATAFGRGDLARLAPSGEGPPELRQLARTFNRTADRLEELITAQEQFVSDASHQLRTPLTALRLRLESLEVEYGAQQGVLEEIGADNPDAGADLQAALTETVRLSRLVDELLTLARADRAEASASAAPIAVDEVLADRAQVWQPIAAERSVSIDTPDETGVRAVATRDRLTQVLDNLIANAIDASPPGSSVRLSAEPAREAESNAGPAVLIRVTDEGRGMTAEQRARAFDRFWRGPAVSPESEPDAAPLGGSGLGLAIVEKLVHADGGDVSLEESASGGVEAVIRLPGVG
jgi:signal transduction histidine kinase